MAPQSPAALPHQPGDAATSARMRRVRREGTGFELAVRAELRARGVRYRLHVRVHDTPQVTPDIVFGRIRVAVFLDGCFWHGCPDHHTPPVSNSEWWAAKVAANQARDRRQDTVLHSQGWEVLRFWEHEHPSHIADTIVAARRDRSNAAT